MPVGLDKYLSTERAVSSEPARRAVAVLAILGATAFLFWPLFAGMISGDPPFFEWDVPEQYWPDLVYLCDSLHRGELPYWNPYDRGGYPYYADPQSAAYHPSSWAICAVAGPSPAMGWATARVVLGFALAGLFGLLWLRRIGASWPGAIAGAVVIEAAPFMRHNWELNLTGALAYAPLILWAADRLAVERRLRDAALFVLAVALCGWMGSPPALWLASSLGALYFVFRLGEESRADPRALRRALPSVGVAILLVIGLLGVVLVPGLELAEHSVQAGRGFDSIAEGGLDADALVALVWPQPGNHLYVGWIAIIAGVFALFRRDRQAWFFWVIAVIAVLLSLGANGPLFRFAFDHVPGVAFFRLPHRYEAWLGPSFGALTALGLTELERWLPQAPWKRALASPWLGVALAAIVLLDVSRAMPGERHMRSALPPARADVAARVLESAPGQGWRVMDEFAISCRAGTRHRRRDLRGYQDPLLLASYERVLARLADHPELAPQFNVRFALQGPHFLHGWNRHFLPPPDTLEARLRTRARYRDEAERSVLELLDALPFAYFVPEEEIERLPSRQAALARVIELAPSAVAILEGSPEPRIGHARPRARPLSFARHLALSADDVAFTIDAPSRGVVVINEALYPGWRAEVDGAEVAIERANGWVRAIVIEPGSHRVDLSFEPRAGRATRLAWLGSVALALALVIAPALRRRWHSR